jgi:hypothetical protein
VGTLPLGQEHLPLPHKHDSDPHQRSAIFIFHEKKYIIGAFRQEPGSIHRSAVLDAFRLCVMACPLSGGCWGFQQSRDYGYPRLP